MTRFLKFQSAPRVLLRGDHQALNDAVAKAKFQSAPRVLLRGDVQRLPRPNTDKAVSIRAPRSSAGRLDLSWLSTTLFGFQSAPRVLLRGDCAQMSRTSTSGMFQSAPRVLLRGDQPHLYSAHRLRSFNPRPAFFCGATSAAITL